MRPFAHIASFRQEPKMESVHSLSFGTAVLKVLQSKSLPSDGNEDDKGGGEEVKEGENFERSKRFCGEPAPPACPGNGSPGRYTLSKDRRESEILRTIDQEESIRQETKVFLIRQNCGYQSPYDGGWGGQETYIP